MKKKSKKHLVEVKRCQYSNDLYVEIPEELGFKVGDEFRMKPRKDGSLVMTKIEYERIEIHLSDELFQKAALMAHERGFTFNELVVQVLKENLEHED